MPAQPGDPPVGTVLPNGRIVTGYTDDGGQITRAPGTGTGSGGTSGSTGGSSGGVDATGPGSTAGITNASNVQNSRDTKDAFTQLKLLFTTYGLASLAGKIEGYVKQDYSPDTISLLLRDTPEYKARFKGNEDRRARGLAELTPAEYLGLEREYEGLFRSYGLPATMFDQQDDFTKYIGGDVSPSEMQARLDIARASVVSDDPGVKSTYRNWYAAGLTEGDAIAAVLDPDKALPLLERKARSAALGAYAGRQGLGMAQSRAEELADLNVDLDKAQEGFRDVAAIQTDAGKIASRYGMAYGGQKDAEDAVLLNDEKAQRRVRKLGEREEAAFGARGVGDSRSLGGRTY